MSVTSSASTGQAELEAARLLLERMGIAPAELMQTAAPRPPVPTFAEYIAVVEAAVGSGTRRVYGTYWNRVREKWGERWIDEPAPSEIRQLCEYVRANVVVRRNARGGHRAAEHLIAALRCLYAHAIADGLMDENPALGALRQGIELRDVWFRYSEEHPWVLRGVNLTIPVGTAVALVGLNGAGKSTLVKLLCRFYDPTRGSVCWDGVDLRELDVERLRTRIRAVFQDFMSYDLTARENIGIGNLAALSDLDRIMSAARGARLDDAIAGLPHGYETMLTRIFFQHADRDDPDTGVFLSGGQWQRIGLARAFLRDDSDPLILDEPSSGLDAEAEHDIHQRLRHHRLGQTVLISHRLNAVRDAEVIAVLAGGEVVEQGSHDDLIAAGGRYARLFHLQAQGYSDGVGAATWPA